MPLDCRTVFFRQGRTAVALISLDLCAISDRLTAEIQEAVSSRMKDPPHLVLNCSHSHEAPFLAQFETDPVSRTYEVQVVSSVVDSVLKAASSLAPATARFAEKTVEGLNRNRRKKDHPVDRSLSLVSIEMTSGEPIALLWRFSAHPIVHQNLEHDWTPDFPGITNRILESRHGCHCQYLQGICGDAFPLDWYFGQEHPRYPTSGESERFMGESLAGHLDGLLGSALPMALSPLLWNEQEIRLEARTFPWALEEARRRLEELEPRQDDRQYVPWGPQDHVVNLAQHNELRYQILALRLLLGVTGRKQQGFRCSLTAVRLGDLFVAAVPGEMFCPEGLELARHHPVHPTFVLNCTNGYVFYIPSPPDAAEVADWDLDNFLDQKRNRWAYGATITTYVAPDSATRIVAALRSQLHRLTADG